MKFKDTKVGDIVYLNNPVHVGWGKHRNFYLPKEVTKVTSTRFNVGDLVFKKEDGSIYGSSSNRDIFQAYLLGDKKSSWEDGVIADQSKERDLFLKKLDLTREVKDIIYYLGQRTNHLNLEDVDDNLLKEVLEKLNLIKTWEPK